MLVPPVVSRDQATLLDARRRDHVAERPEGAAGCRSKPAEQRDDERHLCIMEPLTVEVDVEPILRARVFGLPSARRGGNGLHNERSCRAPIAGGEHRQTSSGGRLARMDPRIGSKVTSQDGIRLLAPSIHGGVGGADLVAIGLGAKASAFGLRKTPEPFIALSEASRASANGPVTAAFPGFSSAGCRGCPAGDVGYGARA
jgi:hypothetical protein